MMNTLQRRVKRSPAAVNALSERMTSYQNALWSRWQALSSRDQLALSILIVFLLLFIGGYSSYSVHKAATDNKNNYQQQVADYFWLRSQAGNIDNAALAATGQDEGSSQPPANRVSTVLNGAGIDNAQVVANGEAVQFSFTNPSQALVSAVLAKLEQQGWQFTQLSIQQDLETKQIQVQATISAI